MRQFVITKDRAALIGSCMHCGAGERGPVSVYKIQIGMFDIRLCLNCIKILRMGIEDLLEKP